MMSLTAFFNIISLHSLTSTDENSYSKTITCLEKITKKYFKNETLLLIYRNNTILQYRDQISQYFAKSPDVTSVTCNCDHPGPSNRSQATSAQNIIILYDRMISEIDIRKMTECSSWNYRAKILIVIQEKYNGEEDVDQILNLMLKSTKAVNITIMTITNETVQFYTQPPYQRSSVLPINEEKLFQQKIPNDFNGSVIYGATTLNEPYVFKPKGNDYEDGVEIIMLKALARYFNFRMEFKEAPNGEAPFPVRSPDGEPAGLFGLLDRREADIAFHGIRIRLDREEIGDPTAIYYFDRLIWVLPYKKRHLEWKSLFIVFQPEIWYLIVIFVFVTPTTFYLLCRSHGYDLQMDDSFFYVLSQSLCNTWGLSPDGSIIRAFKIVFVFYSLLIVTYYQSNLFTCLSNPKSEMTYESPRDCVKGGLTAFLHPVGKYNATDHDMWNIILTPTHHKYVHNYSEILSIIADNGTVFTEQVESTIKFEIVKNYLDVNHEAFYIPNGIFSVYMVCIYTTRGHPLNDFFSMSAMRLFEGGLIEHWMKDIMRRYKNVKRNKSNDVDDGDNDDNGPKPLSLKHLQGAFITVIILFMFSIVVLICECGYYYYFHVKDIQEQMLIRGS